MVRRAILCAALLLLLASQVPGELRAQRSNPGGAEYGVKLCGREFIRAVIFTCGGSRWKRLTVDGGEIPGYRGRAADAVVQDSTNKDLNQLKLQSLLGSRVEQLQKTDFPFRQQPQKDYFNIFDDYNDYSPLVEGFNDYVRQVKENPRKDPSGTELSVALESDGIPWMKFTRRRRESSVGVAGICCKWGCTKAEISTLC
uniref:Insulin-like domain-containing protein n=1 Tax=Leptobrachium leishanense TaxID=445787 RepID=A0A8C5P7B1_9ANUR